MNDDTSKPGPSLVGNLGNYAELYPDIGRRLREAEQNKHPEVRKRLAALRAALAGRSGRRLDYLAKTWGLTPTEARLATFLTDGGSIATYAALFDVRVGTARSQLKSVFAKMGVNRQTALTALVPRA
jgi:DNA-binding CsgD family transcriptional regulator